MDLRLLEDMPFDEIARRLNDALPEGLRVLAVAEPWYKPGEIAAAEYDIIFTSDNFEEVRRRLDNKEQLTAKKMSKQGRGKVEKEIALAPLIFKFELAANAAQPTVRAHCALAAGSEKNLNPALLMEALGGAVVSVVRTGLLTKDGRRWE